MAMKDGGPAFPTTRSERLPSRGEEVQFAEVTYPGMSLRDWFAGQALAGCSVDLCDPRMVAEWCYGVADAMLAARNTQGEGADHG